MKILSKVDYLCDSERHLVCYPYSIKNLHLMAIDLEIKRCWFIKHTMIFQRGELMKLLKNVN